MHHLIKHRKLEATKARQLRVTIQKAKPFLSPQAHGRGRVCLVHMEIVRELLSHGAGQAWRTARLVGC